MIFPFLLCDSLLFACSSASKVKATFMGVIEEINEQRAIVYVTEAEEKLGFHHAEEILYNRVITTVPFTRQK